MIFGFIGACVGAICSIGSAISSSVSAISSAFHTFASVSTVLGNILENMPTLGGFLEKVAEAVLQALGITQPEEKVEDLGDRAFQAAGKDITPEKFENFDEYMKALREFELDPEASQNRSSAEKVVAGLAVGTMGLEKKFNTEPGSLDGLWLLPLANPDYFTPERIQSIVTTAPRLGGNDVQQYLEGKLSGHESTAFENSLKTQNGSPLTPNETSELYKALDSGQDKWAQIAATFESRNNAP